jgi:WS/DGAT/MGAT family acyltransferase
MAPTQPDESSAAGTARLTREDAARWHMATRENPMVIGGLLLFDRPIPLDELEAVVRAKLMPHGRFRQHVVEPRRWFGRPRWRDDVGFDLREHLRVADGPVDRADLDWLVSERMSAPLPTARSPWVLELVELSDGGGALIVRFQHSLADGQALVSLLEELADEPAKVHGAPRTATARPRRAGVLASLGGALRFLALSLAPKRLGWPTARGERRRALSGRKQIAWSADVPMDLVKEIAHARDHHVADVLLAAVAGVLERAAAARGRHPRALRSLLPVAAPGRGLGNHFASVFVRLPVSRVDATTRLDLIAREMDVVRGGGALRSALTLMRLAGMAAPVLERWAVRWWARRAALVVSSLPGPAAPVRIAGARLVSAVVWAPAPASIGLSLTFFGYAGALHVGVLTDEALGVPPRQLVRWFHEALDELGRGVAANTP